MIVDRDLNSVGNFYFYLEILTLLYSYFYMSTLCNADEIAAVSGRERVRGAAFVDRSAGAREGAASRSGGGAKPRPLSRRCGLIDTSPLIRHAHIALLSPSSATTATVARVVLVALAVGRAVAGEQRVLCTHPFSATRCWCWCEGCRRSQRLVTPFATHRVARQED